MLTRPSVWNEFYLGRCREELPTDLFFVFGSNLAGRHGRGAAKEAVNNYGAIYGQGIGLMGQSYGIPTKDADLNVLPLNQIQKHVDVFVELTQQAKRYFYVTAVGCGLAGYQPHDIAPLFKKAQYCWFPSSWLPYIL